MDHMNNQLNKIVGIACLSMTLHFGASAQTAAPQQDKAAKSSDSLSDPLSSSTSSNQPGDLNKVALISETATKAKSDVKTETIVEPAIALPKVNLKNPALNLKVEAREAKTDPRAFAAPDLAELGEPQSFQATAYALKGRTRTGAQVRRGVIAADPRVLPLGSVVQLRAGKYSGVYTVHDTGKRIKGNVIDVWVPDRHEAHQFGRRQIKLHVLRMGPKGRTKK